MYMYIYIYRKKTKKLLDNIINQPTKLIEDKEFC